MRRSIASATLVFSIVMSRSTLSERTYNLAVGDRVMFLNDDRVLGVKNGTFGTFAVGFH